MAHDMSGLAKAMETELEDMLRQGKTGVAWGNAKTGFRVGAVRKAEKICVYAVWYRPEAYGDDDEGQPIFGMPAKSGAVRVVHSAEVDATTAPAAIAVLQKLPDVYARGLASQYPAT